jgi:hypothetical protein
MSARAASIESTEGVQGAGETIERVMQSLQEDVCDGLPAISGFVGRAVYTVSYGISFGIMFPVMLVASIVPTENALVHGLADGATAARDRVAAWRNGEADTGVDEEQEEDESEGEHDGSASTKGRHRRRTRSHGGRRKASR